MFQIMQHCDRIYTPVQEDVISQAKLAQYEKLLRMLDMTDILERTRRLKLPLQMPQKDGDLVQQMVWGEMGDYVRKLLWEEKQGRREPVNNE